MRRRPIGNVTRIGALGPITAVVACAAVLVGGCGSSARHRASPRLVSIGGGIEGPAGLSASVYLIAQAGAAPKRVITGLEDPLGLAWYRGSLYVASVGRVTVYGDFTGTRFARRKTVIRGPLAHGENNDLVLAPGDGS